MHPTCRAGKGPHLRPASSTAFELGRQLCGILEGVASHRANLDPNCTTNIGCDTRGLAAQSARCLATIGSRVISSTASKATGLGSAVSRPAWAMPKFRSPSTSDGLAPFAVEPGSPSTRHLSTSPVALPLAAWITASSRTLTTADWSATFLDDKTRLGWTAGVGVEHMFAPHWTLRGEWRYVDLGTHTAQCMNGNNVCTGAHADFANTLMLGLVGVAYKF
jgi:opacity protein-like surface antigen